jgi:agmatine deiminase
MEVLTSCNIGYGPLKGTKDIWAVDFMPIQTHLDRFVRFLCNPFYLLPKKYANVVSDADGICQLLGIETLKSNIVLDGGDVIIMTDRFFGEYRGVTRRY